MAALRLRETCASAPAAGGGRAPGLSHGQGVVVLPDHGGVGGGGRRRIVIECAPQPRCAVWRCGGYVAAGVAVRWVRGRGGAAVRWVRPTVEPNGGFMRRLGDNSIVLGCSR
jgi:hypothetical protein